MSMFPWYSGTVHPETIVGGVTAGIDTASERINALMNLGPVGGVFPVGPPAAGSSPGKDKARAQAAYNAAMAAPIGGTVLFWPGAYDVGDWHVLLPEKVATGKSLVLEGSSAGTTTVTFSTDRGAGTYAIEGDGTDSGLYYNDIRNLSIVGPGVRGALGTAPCGMDCIRADSRNRFDRVAIAGFRSGLVFNGNHISLDRVDIQDCLYDAYFIASSTNGDIVMTDCLLTGALMASIGVSSGGVATFAMHKGHLGFSPYAMYIETGAGAGLSGGGIQLHGTSVEALGNGFIFSEDQNARIYGLQLDQVGNFSRAFSTYGIAARTSNPSIYLAELVGAEFRGGMPVASGDGGVFDVTDTLTMEASGLWRASYDSAVTNSQPFVKGPTNSLAIESSFNERDVLKAFSAQVFTHLSGSGGVSAGQLVEWDAFSRVRPHRYYGTPSTLAGVALNTVAAGSREHVIVVTKGRNIPVLCDGAAASSYTLVTSSTTVGKATGIAYDGTSTSTGGRRIVGSTYGGVAVPTSASTVPTQVEIG